MTIYGIRFKNCCDSAHSLVSIILVAVKIREKNKDEMRERKLCTVFYFLLRCVRGKTGVVCVLPRDETHRLDRLTVVAAFFVCFSRPLFWRGKILAIKVEFPLSRLHSASGHRMLSLEAEVEGEDFLLLGEQQQLPPHTVLLRTWQGVSTARCRSSARSFFWWLSPSGLRSVRRSVSKRISTA